MFTNTALVVLGLTLAASPAAADHAIVVDGGSSGCPSVQAFSAALGEIIGDVRIVSGATAGALHVEISDEHTAYRIRVGATERAFTEPANDCAERARKAAVFVALILEPPIVDLAEPPTTALVAPRKPLPTKRPRLALQLDVAAAIETASAWHLVSGGPALGMFVGSERVGAVLGVTAMSSNQIAIGGTTASLTRWPFVTGVRGRTTRGPLALALDGDLAISRVVAQGLDAMLGVRSTRWELGLRGVARIEYWPHRQFAVFADVQADGIPRPYHLVVPTAGGVAGTMPRWWVGGVVGITTGIR
jgi:hypothetical protein